MKNPIKTNRKREILSIPNQLQYQPYKLGCYFNNEVLQLNKKEEKMRKRYFEK